MARLEPTRPPSREKRSTGGSKHEGQRCCRRSHRDHAVCGRGRRPGAGAHHPLGPPQQHRPSGQPRGTEIRRDPCRQERRKAQGARVPGVAARQRDADAIGAARRHPGHDVRGDHIARERRQGIRSAGLPFHRHHRGPGGRAGHRTIRASHARRPARKGSDRAGLLGPWDFATPPTAADRSQRSRTSQD